MASNKPQTNEMQFLAVVDIDWINQFVDTTRLTWKAHIQKTLEKISTANQLPTKIIKNKRGKMVLGYSIEAINLLKEKMEKHPERFDNGRMVKS